MNNINNFKGKLIWYVIRLKPSRFASRWCGREDGQAMIETLLIGLPFLIIVLFAMVQLSMIFVSWFRVHEASFQGVRCAIVAPNKTANTQKCKEAANEAVEHVMWPGLGHNTKVTLYDKETGERRNDENEKSGKNQTIIRWFSCHVYYDHHIITSEFIKSILNKIHPFKVERGKVSSVTHSRLVKPYHTEYYTKGYKGASSW